ncbi:MAG: hypothetical protein ABIK09_09860 [Pseudomonadota bacterium]
MTRRLRNEKTAWDVNPRHLEILREHLPLFLKHAQAIRPRHCSHVDLLRRGGAA